MSTFQQDYQVCLKGGFPLVAVNTSEVDRATKELVALTTYWNKEMLPKSEAPDWLISQQYQTWIWNARTGWHPYLTPDEKRGGTGDHARGLEALLSDSELQHPAVLIMENLHLHDLSPYLIQTLRDFIVAGKTSNRHLFLVGDNTDYPVEIRKQMILLDFALPTYKEIFDFVSSETKEREMKFKKSEIEAAADACLGMTIYEIESALWISIVSSEGKKIDRDLLFSEKAKAVRKSGLLEHLSTPLTLNDVGDLDHFKDWARKIAAAFKDRKSADKYGLPVPKGVLLTGVSGCGKSLAAKALSNLFECPLYRCDIGRMFAGIVGSTEANTRELFKLAEAMAPCVILIDELEKSLAGGTGSNNLDSGVTARLMGNLLYWMEEKTAPVFIVGTANDVSILPPELLRKGRFAEVFFVDLPSEQGREDIFRIHLEHVGRDPKKFLPKLKGAIQRSDTMTGAEIENCIKQAMFTAFADGKREFTPADIDQAISETTPLMKTKEYEMKALREWGRIHARPANKKRTNATTPISTKRKLTLKTKK